MGTPFKNYKAPILLASVVFNILIAATMSFETLMGPERVTLHVEDSKVTMDNGILQVTFAKPQGRVISIRYNGIENLLNYHGAENQGGYWDVFWSYPGSERDAVMDTLDGTEFQAVVEREDQVEISFKRNWEPSLQYKFSYLNTDIRYVMLSGVSGFYTYSILEHDKSWPPFDIAEGRIAVKLDNRFSYMVISDNKQKEMPFASDREPPRGERLAYKEAVLLVDPSVPSLKGEVDDKYQYSLDNKDNKVHGWIDNDSTTGFWVITPSNEFKTGGPFKQDLTSHTGPTSLAMIIGDRYVGDNIHFRLQAGEYWKKTLGPIFFYLNSNLYKIQSEIQRVPARNQLWEDAKTQMQKEVNSWPYNFLASEEYLKSNQRGSVAGRLLTYDRYVSTNDKPIDFSYVGLALPGQPGSWQGECKGYQFWTRADADGNFIINNVIPGNYNLYAWVPGFVGDFMHNVTIFISAGCGINLGVLIFEPPRVGPTLWEIGIPDRSAAEFFIPDPNYRYPNKLYTKTEKYRQYGLWDRYTDFYPIDDLVYLVGISDYKRDWFFAHAPRKVGEEYHPTTWQIKFKISSTPKNSSYLLRIALAAAHMARLEVRVNKPLEEALFNTYLFGDGNAIARHGIHGFQRHYEVPIDGALLIEGENTIYLTTKGNFMFSGIMYDYIRFEGPPYGAKTPRKLLLKFN
ncbi:Rhamnogalacturonate lyase [Rhynchospora pubera]|uniref:rhamnogalacturonan endolyase n=1 Tax=Rhynchospora pubera TaxID=906938 RepID=A0AAV8GUJ6_9POAL|nr:Rhamnogalacturonate lyase [Rhynchospora pubera]